MNPDRTFFEMVCQNVQKKVKMSEGIEFRNEHKHHTSKLFIYAQTFFPIALLQPVNK